MRIYSDTEYMRNDMSATVRQSGEFLYGGPPHRLQRSFGLIKPGDPMIVRRAELVILVGWVPCIVLSNLGITRNIVRRRSERRLQPEEFVRRDFPAEAGTLNAVSRKSDVKRITNATNKLSHNPTRICGSLYRVKF
jgi:porphobilinogen deaminase